jgi:AcrR family transcriptional regulator
VSVEPPSLSQVPRDGRRARRYRSRDLAVDALLDLLDEGVHRPTAQQVAERSGVSLRSIFRIFDDVDTLHAEAANRQLQRSRHLYVEVDDAGALGQRVDEMVGVHERLYSSIAPVRRTALRLSADSPGLGSLLERARVWLQAEIRRVFAVELAAVAEPEPMLSALELVLSFEAWDQLASGQGLDVHGRGEVTTRAVTALLAPG